MATTPMEYPGVGFNSEAITVSTVAIGFTAAKITDTVGDDASYGGVSAMAVAATFHTSDDIRIKWDGASPTASVGIPVAGGSIFVLKGEGNIAQLRMIKASTASGDSTVDVVYER